MSVSLLAPTRHPFSHSVSDLSKLPLADRLAETRGRVEPGDDRGAPDREGQDSRTVASIRAMSASSWATRSMPFYAPEFRRPSPGRTGLDRAGEREAIVRMTRDAFPDFTETIEDVVAEADRIVTRFTSTGTHILAVGYGRRAGSQVGYTVHMIVETFKDSAAVPRARPAGARRPEVRLELDHGRRDEVLPGHGMRRSPAAQRVDGGVS